MRCFWISPPPGFWLAVFFVLAFTTSLPLPLSVLLVLHGCLPLLPPARSAIYYTPAAQFTRSTASHFRCHRAGRRYRVAFRSLYSGGIPGMRMAFQPQRCFIFQPCSPRIYILLPLPTCLAFRVLPAIRDYHLHSAFSHFTVLRTIHLRYAFLFSAACTFCGSPRSFFTITYHHHYTHYHHTTDTLPPTWDHSSSPMLPTPFFMPLPPPLHFSLCLFILQPGSPRSVVPTVQFTATVLGSPVQHTTMRLAYHFLPLFKLHLPPTAYRRAHLRAMGLLQFLHDLPTVPPCHLPSCLGDTFRHLPPFLYFITWDYHTLGCSSYSSTDFTGRTLYFLTPFLLFALPTSPVIYTALTAFTYVPYVRCVLRHLNILHFISFILVTYLYLTYLPFKFCSSWTFSHLLYHVGLYLLPFLAAFTVCSITIFCYALLYHFYSLPEHYCSTFTPHKHFSRSVP